MRFLCFLLIPFLLFGAVDDVSIVDPDNGGGTDYTSLNAWESGEQRDITTGADTIAVATCRSTSGSADVTAVSISGWTTSAASYIKVWTDPTESYRHNGTYQTGNQYRLTGSDASLGLIRLLENYATFDGIQFGVTVTADNTGSGLLLSTISAPTDVKVSNCIFKGVSMAGTGAGYGIYVADADWTTKVWNNIVLDFISGSDTGFRGISLNGAAELVYNNTVHNCYTGIYGGSNSTIKNNAVFDCTDDINASGATLDYNASDDGDGTNSVQPADWTDVFENVAGDDFHLKSTDTDLQGAGTDNPGSGLYDDDIDGDTRTSTWDIGADEYVSEEAPARTRRRFVN